jgi:hypothetical protein
MSIQTQKVIATKQSDREERGVIKLITPIWVIKPIVESNKLTINKQPKYTDLSLV